jgi:microsomal dipeptidase-like Zn-dependent dipeptidase
VQEQALGFDPESHPPAPYTTTGHRNSRGLQHQGRVALDALTRLGAMIDVDHMGEKTVEETLQHTARAGYPVFAGHNAVRKAGGTERAHIAKVAGEIMDRGGMWGAGIKDGTQSLHATISQLRQLSPNGGIAVGSDCSGMELLPAEREMPSSWPETPTIRDYEAAGFVVYRDLNGAPANALERCKFGNREYDIDFDGFAHIGMYPDFLEDGVSSGHLSEDDLRELFRAPEAFVQAWENCLAAAGRLGPAAVADLSYLVPLLLED